MVYFTCMTPSRVIPIVTCESSLPFRLTILRISGFHFAHWFLCLWTPGLWTLLTALGTQTSLLDPVVLSVVKTLLGCSRMLSQFLISWFIMFFNLNFYGYWSFACMYVCAPHMCLVSLRTKRASDPQELILYIIVSCHTGAGNQTQVFLFSDQLSLPSV